MSVSVPGGGGALIFSYIGRLRPFLGLKILNFSTLFGFQKNEYFLGYEEYFLGVLGIPGIFWGVNGRCVPEPTYDEQIRVPLPLWGLRAVLCRLKGPFECETKCRS